MYTTLVVIKSFDHEGWAKKIIAFPEGVEPSCCHTATSERRRIRLKADYLLYCSARSEHQAFAVW